MSLHDLRAAVRDHRGIALPMAMMTLLLLMTLTLTFATLAQTEPAIALNHLRATQAVALAESGIEYAVWALTHAALADGFVPLGHQRGVELAVTGADPHLRVVRAVGVHPAGRAQVLATLVRVKPLARDATCALCAGAATSLIGSVVDARGSEATECGAKTGVDSTEAVTLDAATHVFGAGAPAGSPPAVPGRDWRSAQPPSAFLTADDLLTLKTVAMARGTYVRPPSDARLALTAMPAGLVFVDTPDGTNALTATNAATVAIGPAFAASAPFRGWLVVNGTVVFESGADLDALVYAAHTIVTEGPAAVDGLVVARQALGAEPLALTDLTVRFDCAAAQGSGLLPRGWFVRTGTYCDGTAGC